MILDQKLEFWMRNDDHDHVIIAADAVLRELNNFAMSLILNIFFIKKKKKKMPMCIGMVLFVE